MRVVLFGRVANLLDVRLAVALERLLRLVGVVEVDELIRLANAIGVIVQLVDEPVAAALEEVVLLHAVPRKVGLKHWDFSAAGQPSVV